MTDTTDRLAFPLLAAGQAQKEITHNEALALADMLIQPVVQSASFSAPPASPQQGHCWIIASAPTGAWIGKEGHLACWTNGGWRFVAPFEGLQCWNLATQTQHRHDGTGWITGQLRANTIFIGGTQVVSSQKSAIAEPTGGTTIDSEARITLLAILTSLRSHGLIAS